MTAKINSKYLGTLYINYPNENKHKNSRKIEKQTKIWILLKNTVAGKFSSSSVLMQKSKIKSKHARNWN
jgi:hypothetical protein